MSGFLQIGRIGRIFFLFAYTIYIIGNGKIYPHLLHFPHPTMAAIQNDEGAESVRCAGKKVQKTIYVAY